MFFKQLATKEASLSYFFGCAGHAKAVAVDVVAGDDAWFIEEARKAGVTITHVIDTHLHADHYSGGRKLAGMVGAPYCLHESDRDVAAFPFESLHEGQRLDLAGKERAMAGQLYDTLHRKLLTLPAEVEIFPGHQAGSACGAGISGKPSSSIGFEKRWNETLSMSRDAFIQQLTSEIPPRPADMNHIVAANMAA